MEIEPRQEFLFIIFALFLLSLLMGELFAAFICVIDFIFIWFYNNDDEGGSGPFGFV